MLVMHKINDNSLDERKELFEQKIDNLKIIAIVSMLVDHVYNIFLSNQQIVLSMLTIGRMSYPFFIASFALQVVHNNKKDYKKSIKNTLKWMLIAYPAYCYCFQTYEANVLILFLFCLVILHFDALRETTNSHTKPLEWWEKIYSSPLLYPILMLFLGLCFISGLQHSYSITGPLLTLSAVYYLTQKENGLWWQKGLGLFGITMGLIVINMALVPSNPGFNNLQYLKLIWPVEALAIAAGLLLLPVLAQITPKRRWLPHNAGVVFYAVHLYILALLAWLIK